MGRALLRALPVARTLGDRRPAVRTPVTPSGTQRAGRSGDAGPDLLGGGDDHRRRPVGDNGRRHPGSTRAPAATPLRRDALLLDVLVPDLAVGVGQVVGQGADVDRSGDVGAGPGAAVARLEGAGLAVAGAQPNTIDRWCGCGGPTGTSGRRRSRRTEGPCSDARPIRSSRRGRDRDGRCIGHVDLASRLRFASRRDRQRHWCVCAQGHTATGIGRAKRPVAAVVTVPTRSMTHSARAKAELVQKG